MRRLIATPLVMVALLLPLGGASAAGTAAVEFAPQHATASVGAAIAVDVTIANVDADPGLAEYDLTLHVDPAVVRINDFKDSGFIATGQTIVVCVPGTIDNTAGTAVATCTAVPLFGLPGVSTTPAVALLHASFTALAPGVSPLTLSGTLSGPTGGDIPATFGVGSISVSAPASAASPTSKPSATPTQAVSPTSAVQTSTATPTAQLPASTKTPAPASPTVAAAFKAPQTGSGGSGGGYSWAVLAGALMVCGGVLGIGSYALWRRGRAQMRN